jgi:hypothetical protein
LKQPEAKSTDSNLRIRQIDFVDNKNNNPLIVQMSYGFIPLFYKYCPMYWDERLNKYGGKFCPENWMVESVLKQIKASV